MAVVLFRKSGEGFTVTLKEGTEKLAELGIFIEKIGTSTVKVVITGLDKKENTRMEIHRFEHFEGQDFEKIIRNIEKPYYRYINIVKMLKYKKKTNHQKEMLQKYLTKEERESLGLTF